jgi:hypothetical protein
VPTAICQLSLWMRETIDRDIHTIHNPIHLLNYHCFQHSRECAILVPCAIWFRLFYFFAFVNMCICVMTCRVIKIHTFAVLFFTVCVAAANEAAKMNTYVQFRPYWRGPVKPEGLRPGQAFTAHISMTQPTELMKHGCRPISAVHVTWPMTLPS